MTVANIIVSNWKKSLLVTAAALVVSAAVPAVSQARTDYPVITPPADVLSDTAMAAIPVKKSTKHKTLAHKTSVVKKATVHSKHKHTKKHKKTTTKAKSAV
jgi:hypothetical protein